MGIDGSILGAPELALLLGLVAACSSSEITAGSRDASILMHPDTGQEVLDAGADGCRVPSGVTALCVTFAPEAVTPETEPGLDERGFLELEVFDRPNIPLGSASALARYDRVIPSAADAGAEIALSDLPSPSIVLSNPPPTVYVRAFFFDHGGFDSRGAFGWGTWLGGVDLSHGLVQDFTLLPVTIVPGRATPLNVPLSALRRLRAIVTTSVTPIGDGQGALSVVASRAPVLPPNATTYGYGIDPCVDVTRGPATVDMVLLGSGKFFVVGFFDDLGIQTPGAVPPGTLLTLHYVDASADGGTYDVVTVAREQYSAGVSLDLGQRTRFPGDPSAIPPNSCADLGLPATP